MAGASPRVQRPHDLIAAQLERLSLLPHPPSVPASFRAPSSGTNLDAASRDKLLETVCVRSQALGRKHIPFGLLLLTQP